MRWYDIVSRILLILSIIDFALAVPVLVQEKRQACVDVVHIPKDVITVLGKRWDEELEKLAAERFKKLGKPVDSSDAHASLSSAPPGLDHGLTDVVQSPGPNPASSTGNPEPSMEPSSPSSSDSSTASMLNLFKDRFNAVWEEVFGKKGHQESSDEPLFTANPGPLMKSSSPSSTAPMPVSDMSLEPILPPKSSEYGSDHETTETHGPKLNPNPNHGSTDIVQVPGPNPELSTAYLDPFPEPSTPSSGTPMQGPFEDRFNAAWDDLFSNKGSDTSLDSMFTPGWLEHGSDHERTGMHASNPNPNPRPSTDPDPNFDWDYRMGLDGPPPLRPASPKEIGLAPQHQVEHVEQPNLGPSNSGPWSSAPPGPDHANVVQSPGPNPASSTANPGPLEEPSSRSSTAPMQISWDHFNTLWDDLWSYKPGAHVPQPNLNPKPSNELDSDRDLMLAHQPGHSLFLRLPLPSNWGEHKEMITPPSPNLGPMKEPEHDVVHEPPPTPELTDPELGSDHQSSSADSLQAAIYAAKGKAKE